MPKLIAAPHQGLLGPVVVIVMDGVGLGLKDAGDAVYRAKTPFLDALQTGPWPNFALCAHGTAVGLADDHDMGNSEVGHNALGAGQINDQGAKRVAQAFADGSVFLGKTWQRLVQSIVHHASTLHLVGLVSDGNVHSHIDQLTAIIARADSDNVTSLCVHALLDGRDVMRTSALKYVHKLEAQLAAINANTHQRRNYRIASGGGRMQVTMDRYQADWPMVARGWALHVHGKGPRYPNATTAILKLREQTPDIGDQDLSGFVIGDYQGMHNDDGAIAFNFRGDRMMQWMQAFEDDEFVAFDRGIRPKVTCVGMTLYDGDAKRPKEYLVAPGTIKDTLGEILAENGVPQFACSETQKFGHVTYFWNGNRQTPFDSKLETWQEVKSLPPPFDARPQMRADAIAEATVKAIADKRARMLRINLANGDMVGHTGNFDATVHAVEAVDLAVKRVVEAALAHHGAVIVTADHGNAEDMLERDAQTKLPVLDAQGRTIAKTSHSLNKVPCTIVLPKSHQSLFAPANWTQAQKAKPGLANVAASCCVLLGYQPPHNVLPSLILPKLG